MYAKILKLNIKLVYLKYLDRKSIDILSIFGILSIISLF